MNLHLIPNKSINSKIPMPTKLNLIYPKMFDEGVKKSLLFFSGGCNKITIM